MPTFNFHPFWVDVSTPPAHRPPFEAIGYRFTLDDYLYPNPSISTENPTIKVSLQNIMQKGALCGEISHPYGKILGYHMPTFLDVTG